MAIDVRESGFTFSGDAGIGVGTGDPAARFDVGEGGALYADMTVGIGTRTPSCRFEVRSDGAVGVKTKKRD